MNNTAHRTRHQTNVGIYEIPTLRATRSSRVNALVLILFLFIATLAPLSAHASVTVGTANSTSLSSGLVGYWPFDGSATNWNTKITQDSSGNGKTGTLTNFNTSATTAPVAGKIGGALKFNGSNQHIALGNNFHLAANGSFTIATWVNPTSIPSTSYTLFSKANGFNYAGSEYSFFLQYNGTYELDIGNGTADQTGTGTTHYVAGVWQHLVVQYDSVASKMYFYRNGAYDGSFNYTLGTPNSNSVSADMGALGGNYYFLNGSLDDMRVYNRVLSAGEVKQLYALGSANVAHSNTVTLNTGLVGYWPLDGNTTNWATNKTTDLSGQGNTGTLVSMSKITSPVAGKIGQALKFNGTSSYIVGSNVVNIPKVTESVWVRVAKNPSAQGVLSGFIDGIGAAAYDKQLYLNTNGTITWYVYDGAGRNVTSATAVTDNKWHHLVGTADGVKQTLYIDGTNVASGAAGNTYTGYINPNIFLNGASNAVSFAAASEDEFRVYNRALSASEVKQLYALGSANVAHSNTVTLSSGLVGYWPLDGNTTNWATNKTTDLSGQNNTGTLVGMSTTTSPVAGKIGQALKFNGSNTEITAGSTASLSNSPFTVSAWAKRTSSGQYDIILSGGPNSGVDAFLHFGFRNGNTFTCAFWGDDLDTVQTYTDSNWHLWTCTYNAATRMRTIYRDSAYVISATAGGNFQGTGTIHIGDYGSVGSYPFHGPIDDVRVYNRALSAGEVQQLYLMGK